MVNNITYGTFLFDRGGDLLCVVFYARDEGRRWILCLIWGSGAWGGARDG